jgi:hypothetical protein
MFQPLGKFRVLGSLGRETKKLKLVSRVQTKVCAALMPKVLLFEDAYNGTLPVHMRTHLCYREGNLNLKPRGKIKQPCVCMYGRCLV